MKILSQIKTLLAMLAVFVSLAVNAQTQPPEIYEAQGRLCGDCGGVGKQTCFMCKGEDLTLKTCWNCKGQDLTQKTCWNCKGQDLTLRTCWNCKGQDLTQKACWSCRGSGSSGGARCVYCSGSGRESRCVYCSGGGSESRCVYCSGGGRESRCVYCSGSGRESKCAYCGGKAAAGTICQTCNGIGAVEVLVAKHVDLDGLRKSIASQSGTAPRAPPLSTVSDTFTTEDGSSYGEISKDTGRPKTVFVRGYTRKDGTYVKSHFRSLPSSQVVLREPALRFTPAVAENGSYYGEPNQYGVPKTVPVSGYYRKDGTYVRGHYRSAPRR